MPADDFGTVDKELKEKFKVLGKFIDEYLNGEHPPKKWGFNLLAFEFGEKGRMNYISNSEREDMIKTLKEFLANLEEVPTKINLSGSGKSVMREKEIWKK